EGRDVAIHVHTVGGRAVGAVFTGYRHALRGARLVAYAIERAVIGANVDEREGRLELEAQLVVAHGLHRRIHEGRVVSLVRNVVKVREMIAGVEADVGARVLRELVVQAGGIRRHRMDVVLVIPGAVADRDLVVPQVESRIAQGLIGRVTGALAQVDVLEARPEVGEPGPALP